MERQEILKVFPAVECLSHHKKLIKHFSNETIVEVLLDINIFSFLFDATDARAPYDKNKYSYLDICKKAIYANDPTSGYARIAKGIGKNTVYIIKQFAEHYLIEIDEPTNLGLFTNDQEL